MTKHAWLLISLLFGIGYMLGAGLIPLGPWHIAVKGGGVAALALYALGRSDARTRPIAWVMALGALGDVLIELNLIAGALAFLAGHGVACWFYWTNRRELVPRKPRVIVPIILGTVVVSDAAAMTAMNLGVGFYGVGLGAMLGCAWISRFRRDRVALGALLFTASDFLLFARMGALSGSPLPGLLVWPLYYGGQVLITLGVVGV